MSSRFAPTLTGSLVFVSFLAALLVVACGAEETPTVPDAAPRAVKASVDAGVKAPHKVRPRYDEKGVPVPAPDRLALGVPVPLGFERLNTARGEAIYRGPIAPEKVYEFYNRYLETSQVIEAKRGWQFKLATPRAPGDRSRLVDVTVLKKGRSYAQVVVFDRMGREEREAPDAGTPTEEDLRKAAHQGVGSVRVPIPGTY